MFYASVIRSQGLSERDCRVAQVIEHLPSPGKSKIMVPVLVSGEGCCLLHPHMVEGEQQRGGTLSRGLCYKGTNPFMMVIPLD
jgi:hypothetical protein